MRIAFNRRYVHCMVLRKDAIKQIVTQNQQIDLDVSASEKAQLRYMYKQVTSQTSTQVIGKLLMQMNGELNSKNKRSHMLVYSVSAKIRYRRITNGIEIMH